MNIVPKPEMHSKKTMKINIDAMKVRNINKELQMKIDEANRRLVRSVNDAKKQYFKWEMLYRIAITLTTTMEIIIHGGCFLKN